MSVPNEWHVYVSPLTETGPVAQGMVSHERRRGKGQEEEEDEEEEVMVVVVVRERRGPMFISWAVRSYQSNGAECDFSQGISVCLIEILYPIQLASFVASPPSTSFGFVVSPLRSFNSLSFFSPPLSPLRVHTSVPRAVLLSLRLSSEEKSRAGTVEKSRIVFRPDCFRR